MATNSTLYYVVSDSETGYNTWNNAVGNHSVSSSKYTKALVAHNFYAYTDAYTVNSNGSQQGTGNGYLVKAIIKCQSPNKTTRKVAVGIAVYVCRKDGYASNNTLTVKIDAAKAKQSSTYSKHFSTSSQWQKTAYLAVTLNYPTDGTALQETFTITGYNETGTCKSIENGKITIQLPDIGSKYEAADFEISQKELTIGTEQVFTIVGRDPALFVNVGISYTADDNTTKNIYIHRDKKLDELTWTPPYDTILPNITKKKKAACTWYLTTYTVTESGERGTKVGPTKSLKGYLVVPENDANVGYKITSCTVSDSSGNGSTATNSGDTLVEGYESGVSKPKLELTIDNSKVYGATIQSITYSIATLYKEYKNVNLAANKKHSYTAESAINGIGEYLMTAVLTDSRGIEITKSVKLSFINASIPPDITALTASRGTGNDVESFTQDDEGSNVRVWFKAESSKIKEDGTGTMSAIIKYKEVGDEEYTQYPGFQSTTSNGVYSMEVDTILTGLDSSKSYVIRTEVSDPAVRYRETNLSSALYYIELAASGTGVSIGEKAEVDQTDLRIKLPTKFSSTVLNKEGATQFTSDERKKKNIFPLIDTLTEEGLLKIYSSIDPISYEFKEDQRETPLTHFGFSANKLKSALNDIGVDVSKCSIVQEYEEVNKNPIDPNQKIVEHFLSMSYEELTPINFLAIKLILKELININNRLKEIEDNGKKNENV